MWKQGDAFRTMSIKWWLPRSAFNYCRVSGTGRAEARHPCHFRFRIEFHRNLTPTTINSRRQEAATSAHTLHRFTTPRVVEIVRYKRQIRRQDMGVVTW